MEPLRYALWDTVEAVGHWIGLTSCLRCGAALLAQKDVDVTALHDAWHEAQRIFTPKESHE